MHFFTRPHDVAVRTVIHVYCCQHPATRLSRHTAGPRQILLIYPTRCCMFDCFRVSRGSFSCSLGLTLRFGVRRCTASNGGGEEAAEEVETDWKSGNKNQSYPRGEIQGTETLHLHIFLPPVGSMCNMCDFCIILNRFPSGVTTGHDCSSDFITHLV